MPNTILFDLDGTLLDTLDDLADAVNHALTAFSLPTRDREQTRRAVGNGVRNLMIQSIPLGEQDPNFEAILNTFRNFYAEHSMEKTAPYEGIAQLLCALKEKGMKIGIVSNKFDAAVKQISEHYFGSKIDIAIGEAEERGIRKKPAPDSVLEALRLLQASPEEAVYIGDSEVDIETARNARVPCISVAWGFREKSLLMDAGADCLAETVAELGVMLGLSS